MSSKKAHSVGDRVSFHGQSKSSGVTVEIRDDMEKGIKVHWLEAPKGENLHRNGRGSYDKYQLKIVKI